MTPLLPLVAALSLGAAPPGPDLAADLRRVAGELPATDQAALFRSVRGELHRAGLRESRAWRGIASRAGWEEYRDRRLRALEASLGRFPDPPRDLKVRVRRTLAGAGCRIDYLTFESRPGLVVTANLYRPARPGKAMPGLVLVHSHHNPRTQGELQDMGLMWARAGCLVLVMDLLGHGERRQHPFRGKEDYPESYRPTRQDYYFRYNLAIQLQTAGDGLMGWLCWDLRRGVDLLLAQPGVDREKVAVLGAVAGGGDPAAVTAALDRRVAAAVVFNFGGPQPETRYPLPADPEDNFLYTGSGSWESTRNLYRSAKDGFLPWVIVGAAAPRRHLYGHEFTWDDGHDPVWKRLQKIHAWYGTPGHLASARGFGRVTGRPPEASHCNNIGPVQRKGVHEAFRRWFGLAAEEPGPGGRRPADDLLCLAKGERLEPLHRLAAKLGAERAEEARKGRAGLAPAQRREALRRAWARVLGDVEPAVPRRVLRRDLPPLAGGVRCLWVGLSGEVSPWALLLTPPHAKGARLPAVVAFAQGGPRAFLDGRTGEVAELLGKGRVVVLASLGGPSDQPPGAGRGRTGPATALASSLLMLGRPALGERLRELRTLLAYLRTEAGIDPARLALWGDSFARTNPPGTRLERPLDVAQPALAEPLGGVLALLAGLFEDGLASVRARGGLAGYQALLESPFVHAPYDVVVPGALTTGDLADVAAALAPLPLRLEGLVDGLNRAVPAEEVRRLYEPARAAYRSQKAEKDLVIASPG
jgi:dienelactone hydrolase